MAAVDARRTGMRRPEPLALLRRRAADRESNGTIMRIRTAHFPPSRPSRTSTPATCPASAATCSPTWPPAPSSPSRERDPARPARHRQDPPCHRARGQGRPRRLLRPVPIAVSAGYPSRGVTAVAAVGSLRHTPTGMISLMPPTTAAASVHDRLGRRYTCNADRSCSLCLLAQIVP
jgi:hypothetical protein